jgi:hypothetical protein
VEAAPSAPIVRVLYFTPTLLTFTPKPMYVPIQCSKPDNNALGAQVFNDENISLRTRAVYGVLTKYCSMNRTCTVSHKMLMAEFGGSRSMINRAVRELEVKGIVTRQRGSREVRYRLLK